ncbi:hypothetical protein C8R48DRAFT_813231 [Suillus tomentosus]|nr:hypothetical protein C8R48DRAFT_813231 [Suillus tomentosus]
MHNVLFAPHACYILHDIHGCSTLPYPTACDFENTRLGSAFSSVWRQTDVPSSWWTTSAVAAYLASITVLHVTSSTLLQFQTFNASMTTSVPTTLGWLNDSSYSSSMNLGLITLSLPVVNHLTGLASAGLSNTTLYDTLKTNGPDQIYIIPGFENGYSDSVQSELNGVFLMVSTLLEIDPSVQDEVAVAIDKTSIFYTTYVILLYNARYGVVDMQTNSLLSPTSILQPSTQWEMKKIEWSSTNWQAQISSALAKDTSNGISFNSQNVDCVVDKYLMSMIGLNTTEEYMQYTDTHPISNFTLKQDELEFAAAKAAAQLIWLAGQMGTSNGGIDPGNGTAYVNEEFISLHLNINLLPLAFVVSASVIMLGLALHMTRAFDASHDRQAQAAIPNIASINEVLEDVQHPTEADLWRAGMIDVCFSNMMPNEGEFGSSTASDSLSCDEEM